MERKAKIIATMGPACGERETIINLIRAGVNVARLNFSHGTHESHALSVAILREVSRELNIPFAILQDLQGPKIRVGILGNPMHIIAGQEVILYLGKVSSRHGKGIPVDFPPLFLQVKPGNRVLLDDGRIALLVQKADPGCILAEAQTGGVLTSNKGLNIPDLRLDIPPVTTKDMDDLAFGLSLDVDMIAISFVRRPEDIQAVRSKITGQVEKPTPLLIAKLERPEAVENLKGILDAADGVMIARGDLGVELAPEDVPSVQKSIIKEANHAGKIVITATQMLESMIQQPLPTRAEASDVANAVYDGTDALMLSGETAVGAHPVEAVVIMDRIIRQAEASFDTWGHTYKLGSGGGNDAIAICLAARELAHDRDVEAICVFTRTGRTAMLMAKTRPGVPILAFTPMETTYRRLAIGWGVVSHHVPWADTFEEMIGQVERVLREKETVKPGQQVVLVSGFPVREFPLPNLALLHTVT